MKQDQSPGTTDAVAETRRWIEANEPKAYCGFCSTEWPSRYPRCPSCGTSKLNRYPAQERANVEA